MTFQLIAILKFALKNPRKVLRYAPLYIKAMLKGLKVSSKTEYSSEFFEHYLNYNQSEIIEKLNEYWKKYRFFDRIIKEIKPGMKILDGGEAARLC